MSDLSAHLALIEEQLVDGREWLFDTESPSLADVAVHFVYNWIRPMKNVKPLFDESRFPNALKWLDRLSTRLAKEKKKQEPKRINGEEAAKVIASAPFEPYNIVGFDKTEANRLNLQLGQTVSVTPDDTGRSKASH
ncbi:hypothetical protein VNI00_005584 [Paramarasmius palmivorus]|uniref:GST C-terminal domain-containing protein n=1 Tax=Paramarasmius palmivorus TaxID=297713 RepID=A0AAW0DEK9_9AGAR